MKALIKFITSCLDGVLAFHEEFWRQSGARECPECKLGVMVPVVLTTDVGMTVIMPTSYGSECCTRCNHEEVRNDLRTEDLGSPDIQG